jgi:hypothetical protein
MVSEVSKQVYGDPRECKMVKAMSQIELKQIGEQMENHLTLNSEFFDALNRKVSVYDIELGNKDVILRLDLDIPLSKFIPPAKINDLHSLRSVDVPVSVGRDSKLNARRSEIESVISASPLGVEEDYWRQR